MNRVNLRNLPDCAPFSDGSTAAARAVCGLRSRPAYRSRVLVPVVVAWSLFLAGCEYAFSDAATRVRYALVRAEFVMRMTGSETDNLALNPDHWPDGCGGTEGYQLAVSPYKGDKQVAVGDIDVYCQNGRRYYTGFGSERIHVAKKMTVEKKPGETLHLVLRKSASGVEIVELR
jgi:hypothetical protein